MTEERDAALDEFFKADTGRARTAGDAVALATESLKRLEAALSTAAELGDEHGTPERATAEAAIHDAALALGIACVDALKGLMISNAVNRPVRRSAMATDAPPLGEAWQTAEEPHAALGEIAAEQRERLPGLQDQTNQLFRHLHESLALAADAAAWTAWAALPDGTDE